MRIHTLIVLGALLAAAASLAAAQEAGSASFSASAVLTDSRVRMRGSPGLEGATLGFLNKGDHVTVVGVSDTADHIGDATDYWYHVTTADSKDGWVFGAFLSFDRSEAPAQQWQVILDAKVRHYGTRFLDVTANSGGVWAVGSLDGGFDFPFSDSVTLNGPASENALVARYTPGGSLQWVRTLAKASDASSFAAAAADAAGNLYAVGTIDGTGECSFGSGVSVAGAVAGQNAVIVKYGPTGLVLWARTVSSAASQTGYSAVAVDVSGSVYAVGHTTGSGAYGFGGSVTVKGTANKDKRNALLVKYDSSGAALWARTSSGKAGAEFTAVAADATRNAYVLGSLAGAERYGFGGKVSANASGNGDSVLVLYDASGAVQWDDTFPASAVSSMAVDSQGGIYLGGYLEAGVKATLEDGSAASAPDAYGAGVLIKYDPAGKVGWIEATNDPQDDGGLRRLVIDSNGGIYALGSKENGAFLVRFGADGRRVWSQSIDPFMEIREGDIDREGFYAMAADPHGALYVVGVHTTVDVADYGLLGRY